MHNMRISRIENKLAIVASSISYVYYSYMIRRRI
uniref:Uncharacterized protein n=1 Tax=Setaria italica TaxID=4555 RepID=K3Y479_SETIT